MNSINKILVYAVTVLMSGFNCYGQNSSLKDLSRIELITAGAWIDGYYKKVEVVNENGQWKSYQTRLASNGYSRDRKAVNDSSRTFLMDVPDKTLIKFLSLLVKPDSVIREELFNIKTDGLIAQIDSTIASQVKYGDLTEQPTAKWRNEFVKAVKIKELVSKAFHGAMHPMRMDDRSYYYIIISNRFNKADTITADARGDLYYLPWRRKGKESYNPNITKLFEQLSGNYAFEQKELTHLYSSIILEFYYSLGFKASYNWERFKTQQSELYVQASKTLIPWKGSHFNDRSNTPEQGFTATFLSTRLPSYIEFRGSYAKAYLQLIPESNALEERLVEWYKSGSFLFDYMKGQPHSTLVFGSASLKKEQIDMLARYYPELKTIDRSKIRWFTLLKDRDYNNSSLWLLLPDDKLILTRYGGKLASNYQDKLAFIPAKLYKWTTSNVCIVFNKEGKVVGGTDVPYEIKPTE